MWRDQNSPCGVVETVAGGSDWGPVTAGEEGGEREGRREGGRGRGRGERR